MGRSGGKGTRGSEGTITFISPAGGIGVKSKTGGGTGSGHGMRIWRRRRDLISHPP
jgi:hypothetical protein